MRVASQNLRFGEKNKREKKKEGTLFVNKQPINVWRTRLVTDSKVGSEKISFQSFRKTVAKTRKYTFEEISGPLNKVY